MLLAILADARPEGQLVARAFGTRRKHVFQRRVIEALRQRVIRPDRRQKRAALLNEARDIVEIDRRQQRLVGIAIEDDEIEFVDLAPEEIGCREGDQREFGRRA